MVQLLSTVRDPPSSTDEGISTKTLSCCSDLQLLPLLLLLLLLLLSLMGVSAWVESASSLLESTKFSALRVLSRKKKNKMNQFSFSFAKQNNNSYHAYAIHGFLVGIDNDLISFCIVFIVDDDSPNVGISPTNIEKANGGRNKRKDFDTQIDCILSFFCRIILRRG